MGVVLTMFLFLLSAGLWFAVSCKDVEKLVSRLQREEEMGKTMTNLQKYDKEDVRDVLSTMENIQNLWTVHLTKLLQESNMGSAYNLSQKCHKSARNILEYQSQSLFYPWNITVPGSRLIPLLDATGKQGAGLLTGNVILDGAYDECFSYNYTGYCVASSVSLSPKVANISVFWKVGMCVPKGCNSYDISLLINETKVLQADQATITCLDSKFPDYNVGAIVMLIITGVFILLVIAGTVVEIVLMHTRKKDKKESSAHGDRTSESNTETGMDLEKANLLMKTDKSVKLLEFITAFSLFKTVPALLATKQAPSVITSLNGLRVISMFYIILGHAQFWIFQAGAVDVIDTDNTPITSDIMARFTFQAIETAFFGVDSFFFISGVLVAYLTLREMKKKKDRFPFIHFYVHRYLRLTPTYAFVLFFTWFLTPHLAYGPNMMDNPFSKSCRLYWWTNLLYINNFYPWLFDDVCINWTWYLANDMQFYIIAPLILIPAYHFLPVGIIISGLLLASGCIVTGAISGIYDFQANKFSILAYGYTSKPGSSVTYFDVIYTKPWNHIAPYIVGLALGYILYRSYRLCYSRITSTLLYGLAWAIAAFVAFWLFYGLYFTWQGHVPTSAENIIYITFSQFLWGLCLALMVFACHNGYGWFVNSFLSMKMWTPLARMTFNAYLVHPVVLTVVYGQLQTPMHYTDITVACYTVAFVVLSYGVAAILCVLVEQPLGTVEMLVFKLFGSISCNRQSQDVNNYEEIKEPVKIC